MIKKDLKILDFKSGKPILSPHSWNERLIQRIIDAANLIGERSRQSQANWVVYTGVDGAEQFNGLLGDDYLSNVTNIDGVEGRMNFLGADWVLDENGDISNAVSVRYAFQPTRGITRFTHDFTITPTGEFTSFSG